MSLFEPKTNKILLKAITTDPWGCCCEKNIGWGPNPSEAVSSSVSEIEVNSKMPQLKAIGPKHRLRSKDSDQWTTLPHWCTNQL